jgi:Short C-terminal domain
VGLLKTAATVAVASSVHGRVQRRQQARWAAQDPGEPAAVPGPPNAAAPPAPPQAPAAPAQSADMGERLAQLTQLGELMKAGVLTEAEFQQQKARILNG